MPTRIAPPEHHGSCLCGAVTYRLHQPIKAVTHCHCSQCRKSHGAAFASYGSVRRSALECLSGQALIRIYRSSPTVSREFCSCCGSSLFWSTSSGEFPDWVSIALGTLDTPFVPKGQRHSHVESKTCWYSLADAGAPGS